MIMIEEQMKVKYSFSLCIYSDGYRRVIVDDCASDLVGISKYQKQSM